jgi:hypothetical protein
MLQSEKREHSGLPAEELWRRNGCKDKTNHAAFYPTAMTVCDCEVVDASASGFFLRREMVL